VGGEVISPIYIVMSGRAINEVNMDHEKIEIPVGKLAIESAKGWLKKNIRYLDPESHVIVDHRVGKGSSDLVCNYNVERKNPCSNDTSFGVGYAPLDSLESVVYETERYINSPNLKKKIPEIGEDIKVMGLRTGKEIKLTIAGAMISKLVSDLDHYVSVKRDLKRSIEDFVVKKCELPVEVFLNNADRSDMGSVYITVTGTSAEMGDDGETGRGNRANGLITPSRPMSLEASAGKNPVNHVGKIYNVLAGLMAEDIAKVRGVSEVYVKIVSQIGRSIGDPHMTNVQLFMEDGKPVRSGVKQEVSSIIEGRLENVEKVTELILQGKARLF
jgi:S-adenosylmethionine synthetase